MRKNRKTYMGQHPWILTLLNLSQPIQRRFGPDNPRLGIDLERTFDFFIKKIRNLTILTSDRVIGVVSGDFTHKSCFRHVFMYFERIILLSKVWCVVVHVLQDEKCREFCLNLVETFGLKYNSMFEATRTKQSNESNNVESPSNVQHE
uniref:Uncharacterized protein n=1 Tax=Romanomermis culicivorax TaxID=13658 RepID=A0A915J8Q2_ROMCU